MRKEIKVLKDHTYFLPDTLNIADVFIEFYPIHHNTSLLMLFQMVDTADSCRFARTGRSAQHDAFPLFYLQVDVFQDMKLSVPFVDVFQRNHRVSRLH